MKPALAAAAVLCAVALTYSNHFRNDFHFDDFHTITENVYVRDLTNVPRFFSDATSSSTLPANRAWRPIVSTSLAVDYWLGGGYKPLYFHLSTFVWFLVQLLLMYALFAAILERARPDPRNRWIAWFAVAWYGLHPAIAETVNYIIQRAELLSTLGVVAGLTIYVRFPALRRFGLYLIPVALGAMAKAPALVFPLLLAAYLVLFEDGVDARGFRAAARKSIPAFGVSLGMTALQYAMTPTTFVPSASPTFDYLITQPYVAFRYFASFFLPLHLSADSDLHALTSLFSLEAFGGLVFLAVLLVAIWAAARNPETRPVSFGLTWFLVALAPTSLFPLAEVENDHRMFFPFVGLVIAVTWAGGLALIRRPPRGALRAAVAGGLACLLVLCALGTRRRNEVWRTEESLWRDVTLKSPRNGRGLMNYGLTQMNKGGYRTALTYFENALAHTPNYSLLEINLGIVNAALHRNSEAELHFRRALELAPAQAEPHYYYARWLKEQGRTEDALANLKAALALNPSLMDTRYLLLQVYSEQRDWTVLKALAEDSLKLAPSDPTIRAYLAAGNKPGQRTPEQLLDLSLRHHQAGRYQECIDAAREALRLRPNYAEAYNNIAAAYESMGQWDNAIQAAKEALRIKPDFELARNNLRYSEAQKRAEAAKRK
jgi:tetratricopeptide (TPR) repeat protein